MELPSGDSPRLLTATEVGELLRLKVGTVLKWYKFGRLPGILIANKVIRFDATVIEKMISDGRNPKPRVRRQTGEVGGGKENACSR